MSARLSLPAVYLTLLVCATGHADTFSRSVVKINVTSQRPDVSLPWQDDSFVKAGGSGFVIQEGRKRWILSNAHVVSDARFLEVQREGDPIPRQARVAFAGHDCDLAVLEVDDPAFWERVEPLALGKALPDLDAQVVVVGYPMGGDRLSLTRGVVSRIDYNVYAHSEVDSHLVMQVDAAINPGNSGGPVLFKGRVAGVAFQGISRAQNIGYAIPIPVIRHFLDDIADGTYDGYPELGVSHLETRNHALRRALGLPPDRTGVAVSRVDPLGSAAGILLPGDTLLAIDGLPIANDGSVRVAGVPMAYIELFERKQVGQRVRFDVWRNGAFRNVEVTPDKSSEAFLFRRLYDTRPRWVLTGGLLFGPLTREWLMSLGKSLGRAENHLLLYTWFFGRQDNLVRDQDERVVLLRRLPHAINAYADGFLNACVTEVNGKPIRNLAELEHALLEPVNGFHVFRFLDRKDTLVLDAAEATRAEPEIREAYGIPASANTGTPAP